MEIEDILAAWEQPEDLPTIQSEHEENVLGHTPIVANSNANSDKIREAVTTEDGATPGPSDNQKSQRTETIAVAAATTPSSTPPPPPSKKRSIDTTPTALTVLRALDQNNSDVMLVWCLKVYPGDRSLKMDYIDVATSIPAAIDLRYEFSVFLAVAPCSKNHLFSMLDHAYGHLISTIYDSDLKFGLNPHTLVEALLQTSGAERFVEYDLIRLTTCSYANMRVLHEQLRANNRHKNFYYVIEATNCNTILAFGIMIESLTYRRQHTSTLLGLGEKLVFLKSIDTSRDSSRVPESFAATMFNPQKYFVPCGLYTLQPRTNEISLVSTDTASLFNLLPIVSFDIETITNTMVDIPFGGTSSDQLSSFCLFARYMDVAVILIGYRRVFNEIVVECAGANNAATDYWTEFDRTLENKYHAMYLEKLSRNDGSGGGGTPCSIVTVRVKSVPSEIKLLELFEMWYCRGKMFQSLVPEPASSNQPHLFAGHNIITYDMPFMLRRFKWHQMHDTVTKFMREDRSILDLPIIRFHPRAIIVDTLQIFKNHQLVSAGALKLQQLSNTFIRKTATKLDVNSVLIRVIYLLDEYYTNRSQCRADTPATNAAIKLSKTVAFCEFARTVLSVDKGADPRLLCFPLMSALPADSAGRQYRAILSQNTPELTHVSTYTIDTILRYNIVDCECVLELLYKFDYTNLFTQFIKLYPSTIEMALHGNVTARMDTLFNYYSIKYRQLVPSNTKHLSILKERPVYTHNPDPADLLQVERGPNMSDREVKTEMEEILHHLTYCARDIFPIISQVQHQFTKKKFSGAAVFSKSGYYENTVQFDVVSMYPSIIIAKELSLDSTDMVSASSLIAMIKDNLILRGEFDNFIRYGGVKIFIAEDELNGVGIAKDTTVLSYLYDFSLPVSRSGIAQPNVIGRMVVSYDHLATLAGETPLLICTGESKNFLHSFIKDQLLERKRMQLLKAQATDDLTRRVYDSRQKAIKISVNSMYGIFGNAYPPLAATTTLYGRKILIYAAKVLIVITFELCIRIDRVGRGTDNLGEGYSGNCLSSFEAICNVFGAANDGDSDLSAESDENPPETLSAEIVSRLPVDTRARMLRLYGDSADVVVDEIIRAFYRRALLDGSDSVEVLVENQTKLQECELMWGTSIETLWRTVIPNVVRKLIYDGDTDGFQYQNIFNFDSLYLNKCVNTKVAQALAVSRIVFEPKIILATMCMTKKKYTVILSDRVPKGRKNDRAQVRLSEITISHNGYERNALPCLKYLCTYMAAFCYYIRRQPDISRRPLFQDIIYAFFHYLDTKVPPGELYINIPLTRQQNDSARKQFIEQYASLLYIGSLSAVFVYSPNDPTRENLLLLERYMNDHTNHQLHYSYFFRGFGKIWLNQYLLVNEKAKDVKMLKSAKIVDLIHSYFKQWISTKKPCPLGNDVINQIVSIL